MDVVALVFSSSSDAAKCVEERLLGLAAAKENMWWDVFLAIKINTAFTNAHTSCHSPKIKLKALAYLFLKDRYGFSLSMTSNQKNMSDFSTYLTLTPLDNLQTNPQPLNIKGK